MLAVLQLAAPARRRPLPAGSLSTSSTNRIIVMKARDHHRHLFGLIIVMTRRDCAGKGPARRRRAPLRREGGEIARGEIDDP